jgi:16S rRNA pseudouridine516 synthase
MRLDKLLGHMGFGTRSEIKNFVRYGWVEVDGVHVKTASLHVDPQTQVILFKGEAVHYKEFVYFMMNKPPGVISATEDKFEQTVIDLLAEEDQGRQVFPVGRLDKDTVGLLLLTNHGELAHGLLSPKRHVPKTYYAIVDGPLSQEEIHVFSEGIMLEDGYVTQPSELEVIKSEPEQSEIKLTIYEGKFHQVKRMFEARGRQVTFLKRISMGPLVLDPSLEPGEYRELTQVELKKIMERAGISE